VRSTFLPFALPDLDNTEFIQIKEALASGWITTGPKTRQFEAEFTSTVGAKHAVAVNSCTAAMHLALEAIGLQRGDEVITTPYTFAATAEVIRYFDAKPVLVDVRPDDLNIDPEQVEAVITDRTKVIIPVHIAGLAADLQALYAIAARHNLAVIEDAAHSFPSLHKGRTIGMSPDGHDLRHAVCFSFYATKTITTGEGGMICTDDHELAERCRIMALHGISKDAWKRYTAEGSWYYEVVAPGYKYNMTDIGSGMGLAQLAKAEQMAQRRHQIAHRYNQAFAQLPHLETPVDLVNKRPKSCQGCSCTPDHMQCRHPWHLYMLRLNPERLTLDRSEFISELKDRHIGASVHFIPLHLHPYYRQTYGYQPEDYPVAYREYLREISLPIYSKMSDHDVEDVIDAVLDIVKHYGC
jgi:dTDP-4-amino-4,6-dideoxygalactose transaminase